MPLKEKIVIVSLLFIIGILYSIDIYFNDSLAALGPQYLDILVRTEAMKQENMQLLDEVIEKESLLYINKEARGEGFIPQGKFSVIYLQ